MDYDELTDEEIIEMAFVARASASPIPKQVRLRLELLNVLHLIEDE